MITGPSRQQAKRLSRKLQQCKRSHILGLLVAGLRKRFYGSGYLRSQEVKKTPVRPTSRDRRGV